MSGDLTQTEARVVETFCRAIPPMTCHGGLYMGGRVVLDVSYLHHRQKVAGRTFLDALANVQRLYDDIHAEAA